MRFVKKKKNFLINYKKYILLQN